MAAGHTCPALLLFVCHPNQAVRPPADFGGIRRLELRACLLFLSIHPD
jgi:hypothetical protein